jgi:FtsP/CotA-like multicopper oxidase with cupredoxin domain
VHWHGLDVPERADGHPRLAIRRGQESVADFEVTNRAGTYSLSYQLSAIS